MGRVFKENSVLERFYESWMNDSGTSDELWSFIQEVPIQGCVLDCGCGSGTFTRLCAQYATTVVGIDISPTMIQKAKAIPYPPHVSYHVLDMSSFQLKQRFNRIIAMNDVLNFTDSIEQLQSVVDHVYDHLLPDGIFTFDIHHPLRMDEEGYSESGVLEGCDYEYMLEKEEDRLRHTFLWYEADYPTLEVIFQTLFDEATILSVFDESKWTIRVQSDDGSPGFAEGDKWMIHARRKV